MHKIKYIIKQKVKKIMDSFQYNDLNNNCDNINQSDSFCYNDTSNNNCCNCCCNNNSTSPDQNDDCCCCNNCSNATINDSLNDINNNLNNITDNLANNLCLADNAYGNGLKSVTGVAYQYQCLVVLLILLYWWATQSTASYFMNTNSQLICNMSCLFEKVLDNCCNRCNDDLGTSNSRSKRKKHRRKSCDCDDCC